MDCDHTNTTRGTIYECCEDCGAVRRMAQPGKPSDDWHVCDLCRPVLTNQVTKSHEWVTQRVTARTSRKSRS